MIDKACKNCGEMFLGDGRRKYCDNCVPPATLYMREWTKKPGPKEQRKEAFRKYADDHKDSIAQQGKSRRFNERLQAIKQYGGKCECCGETEVLFLTLDHSRGDGAKHRQELLGKNKWASGYPFYRKLRQLGYPKNIGLRVLCWNCHMTITKYKICPHQNI